MERNESMMKRLTGLDKTFSEQPKRSLEEALAQYDRQNPHSQVANVEQGSVESGNREK